MAKKRNTKKSAPKPKTAATVKAPRARIHGNENILKNAQMMNKAAISQEKFDVGDKIFIQNEDYNQDFRIVEAREEQGTHHRRITGGMHDVIVTLQWLQQEYARDRLKRFDENGKVIDTNEKLSDGTAT